MIYTMTIHNSRPGQDRPKDPTHRTDLEGTEKIWPCNNGCNGNNGRNGQTGYGQTNFPIHENISSEYDVRQDTP
jgi:hypothetical protein